LNAIRPVLFPTCTILGLIETCFLPPDVREFDSSSAIVLLSMNRFERKKNIGLAIRALCELKQRLPDEIFSRLKLILAGQMMMPSLFGSS
jgi:glycosyltransferase involved in cell wall biosynthesis